MERAMKKDFDIHKIIKDHGGVCRMKSGALVEQLSHFKVEAGRPSIVGVTGGCLDYWRQDGKFNEGNAIHLSDLVMPRSVENEWWVVSGQNSHVIKSTLVWAQEYVSLYGIKVSATIIHTILYSDGTVECEVVS
jgi:hypothetical protein